MNRDFNRLLAPSEIEQADPDGMITFAVENQGVLCWGFSAKDTEEDCEIYQQALSGDTYGPWIGDQLKMSDFLISFAYWNSANGAADVTVFGEVTDAEWQRQQGLPVVWTCPDFVVRHSGKCLVIVSNDRSFYLFGGAPGEVRREVRHLDLVWYDLE
ncbi:MAG: hypothetical protein ABI672_14035 [Vicinamibacteria bacterium]